MLYEFSHSPDPWDNLADDPDKIEASSIAYTDDEPDDWYSPASAAPRGVDGIVLTAVLLIILLGVGLMLNRRPPPAAAAGETAVPAVQDAALPTAVVPTQAAPGADQIRADLTQIISPYDESRLTQGLHGYSYGHMAIDLAAGEGSVIKSPIVGKVTGLYVDEYDNTVLVIENERYEVMMMHGDYTVKIGDELELGAPVGTEGNNGYTKNSYGNVCNGRAGCGHHTHLNIFDKQQQTNVNPLRFFTP